MAGSVLYIDDEPALCKAFERALRKTGLRVVTTTSPTHALELIKYEPFDLVMADYFLPNTDGLSLLHTARQYQPDVMCLLVTGQAEDIPMDASVIRPRDVDGIISKPWTLDELRQAIEGALREKGRTRRL